MEIQLELISDLPTKKTELQSFIATEHITGLIIKEQVYTNDETEMGIFSLNPIELIISSVPVTGAILGILNCIKAYIEINKKDKVKISIKGVEIEMYSKNYKKIDKHLKQLMKIIKKYE